VLNSEAKGQFEGMARPGYFFIDTKGTIREKFFEAKYRERLSGNNVIAKLFPELGEEVTNALEAPHLRLAIEQSDHTAFPGELVTLTIEVQLPKDIHVYAPGVKGYKPIKLTIDPALEMDPRRAIYPRSMVLYLPAIKERVPVFEGKFRIRQDVKVNSSAEFSNSLGTEGKTFTLHGALEYQACDSKICFLPDSVPFQSQLQVLPLDRQRAPSDIQHK
jgi:hypothetical protein